MGHAEQQMLQAAIALHSAGKLAEAEAQYRALLGRSPGNARLGARVRMRVYTPE
jgi:hypothetical protein